MYDLQKWCERLIKHEGMILKPYRCPRGWLTIGVGRCLDTNPLSFTEKRVVGDYMHGITENAAMMLLRHDIIHSYEMLKKRLKHFEDLDEERQYALVDMCFQLGFCGLMKFKNMLKYIERGCYDMAAYECLASQYAKQTPKRAKKIAYVLKYGKWE